MAFPLSIPHNPYIKSDCGWIDIRSIKALIFKEIEDKFYERVQQETFIRENNIPLFYRKLTKLYYRPHFTPEVKIRTNVDDMINFLQLSYIDADHQMIIYIAKSIHLLLFNLNELGGCSQKKLFSFLTNFSKRILHLRHNIRTIRDLLKTANIVLNTRTNMSPRLWVQHQLCLERTVTYVDKVALPEKAAEDSINCSFDHLPLHIIYNILKYVQNPEDLYSIQMTNKLFYIILSGNDVWRFMASQLNKDNPSIPQLSPSHNWRSHYLTLLDQQSESYLVHLKFCSRCSYFFWSSDHRFCKCGEATSVYVKILDPLEFISMIIQ